MNDEANEYVVYLSRFKGIRKPPLPKTDLVAYTDSEYIGAIKDVLRDFQNVDDEYITIKHLKGE